MAKLSDILYNVRITYTAGNMSQEISGIAFDSLKVKQGNIFVAIKGTQTDGHKFIESAIESGAKAIFCAELPEKLVEGVTYVTHQNTAQALGIMSSNFYGNPSKKLKLIGVTGTNGKTTVVTLLYKLFTSMGKKCGLLSTIENIIDNQVLTTSHTTLDPIQINELLSQMVEASCTHCFMEVSSHAVCQERIAGLHFEGGVFTNITHDHLDYHETFDAYIKAKKGFFDQLSSKSFALVNVDDKNAFIMLQNCKAKHYTYGLRRQADYKAKMVSNTLEGLEINLGYQNVWFKLIGDFNASNLMAVYGVAALMDENESDVLTVLSSLSGARGRFELMLGASKIKIIIDYAHTPDALRNVLETISNIRTSQEKIIVVVGCGGNRDKTKRPLMAAIACKYADKVILTSDNPRDEAPIDIIKDMQRGVGLYMTRKTLVIENREEAIKTACMMANEMDIVLVAGKGHETYQEIKGQKYPFDDREVVKRMIKIMTS